MGTEEEFPTMLLCKGSLLKFHLDNLDTLARNLKSMSQSVSTILVINASFFLLPPSCKTIIQMSRAMLRLQKDTTSTLCLCYLLIAFKAGGKQDEISQAHSASGRGSSGSSHHLGNSSSCSPSTINYSNCSCSGHADKDRWQEGNGHEGRSQFPFSIGNNRKTPFAKNTTGTFPRCIARVPSASTDRLIGWSSASKPNHVYAAPGHIAHVSDQAHYHDHPDVFPPPYSRTMEIANNHTNIPQLLDKNSPAYGASDYLPHLYPDSSDSAHVKLDRGHSSSVAALLCSFHNIDNVSTSDFVGSLTTIPHNDSLSAAADVAQSYGSMLPRLPNRIISDTRCSRCSPPSSHNHTTYSSLGHSTDTPNTSPVWLAFCQIYGYSLDEHSMNLELADFFVTNPGNGVARFVVLQWEAGKVKVKISKPCISSEFSTTSTTPSQAPRRIHGFLSPQVNLTKGVIFLSYTFMQNPSRFVFSVLFHASISAAIAAHSTDHPTLPPLAHVCAPLFPVDPEAPANKQHSHSSNFGSFTFRPVNQHAADVLVEKSIFIEPGILSQAALARCEK
ncbi:hypothetical protein BDK51DRAFT_29468 [Blyttiomyces helicus]|uniref:Uncharacterized protein n=1 Tax=Blyttiomyces helicus TaxID=388810 RepID=A0A4V1IRT9_9FUNG|nr:hypothetical protein BDK51DRAFT_29468 [Blyttiomyces helicus]|eukprot:RKO91217.1 hypothetical protein BDK51DRAFT_29468 [Blyttiomyces helicus]